MTDPKASQDLPPAAADPGILSKFSPAVAKLLTSLPERDWPRIHAFLIESEEEGELIEMLPEVNRVMKFCPAKLMGRVGKGELVAEQIDKAYARFHDSIHGVRHALQSLLSLAGIREFRMVLERVPAAPRADRPPPKEAPRGIAPEIAKPRAPALPKKT
ncbi:MAG TPA: hypothetical protein VKW04_14165 [Planctomycetota bacterium]|nr:hypothetical protein [Planctomycetota bacterium]